MACCNFKDWKFFNVKLLQLKKPVGVWTQFKHVFRHPWLVTKKLIKNLGNKLRKDSVVRILIRSLDSVLSLPWEFDCNLFSFFSRRNYWNVEKIFQITNFPKKKYLNFLDNSASSHKILVWDVTKRFFNILACTEVFFLLFSCLTSIVHIHII